MFPNKQKLSDQITFIVRPESAPGPAPGAEPAFLFRPALPVSHLLLSYPTQAGQSCTSGGKQEGGICNSEEEKRETMYRPSRDPYASLSYRPARCFPANAPAWASYPGQQERKGLKRSVISRSCSSRSPPLLCHRPVLRRPHLPGGRGLPRYDSRTWQVTSVARHRKELPPLVS